MACENKKSMAEKKPLDSWLSVNETEKMFSKRKRKGNGIQTSKLDIHEWYRLLTKY